MPSLPFLNFAKEFMEGLRTVVDGTTELPKSLTEISERKDTS